MACKVPGFTWGDLIRNDLNQGDLIWGDWIMESHGTSGLSASPEHEVFVFTCNQAHM